MSCGDNIIDNRWRPDFGSSQRRVREELEEARQELDDESAPTVFSRELSFVPNNRRPSFESSNAETRALIRRYEELDALPNGAKVMERLEQWKWPWAGRSAADKQRYLEPLIAAVRRDPAAHEDKLLFLLIVCEPVRRSVSGAFRKARSGLTPQRDLNWSNRAEAKMLNYIERERLEDVTRGAVLTAIAGYPSKSPGSLFGWLRETIAHRALDELQAELPQISGASLDAPEARAIGVFLDLVPDLEAPAIDEDRRRERRILVTDTRRLYDIVDHFFEHEPVRQACRQAIARLPRKQGEIVRALYLREIDAASLAATRGVALSTIHNHSSQARANLYADDTFFCRLHALGIVRDRARACDIERRFPNGRMPDGRRRIVIEEAA